MNKIAELNQAGIRTILSKDSNTTFIPFGGMLTPADKRYIEGYHRKDPWKDVRVREAMNLAVDRQSLAKHIYMGAATPSAIYASLPGWDKLDPIPYDPKRAKQLLTDAGFPNGFGFKFMTHVKDPSLQLVAQTVSSYWEAIGLKPEIIRGDYASWRDTNKAGKTAGAVWTNVMMNYFDWSARLPGHDLPNSSTPFWQGEETTRAIDKVLPETDPKKREAYWKEVAQLYRSLYINVPIAFTPRVHGVSKKIGEWAPARVRYPRNLIFARQAKPLNAWRLFTP
jgi:peptide/nickel transport system substrate-binding protein